MVTELADVAVALNGLDIQKFILILCSPFELMPGQYID
jgi:hypothetical protein